FYPTPNRDNGYDVIDYYAVDSRLGSLGDFVECMIRAHERGIRIVVDLVVNHTSDQHPWFQAARKDPDSKFRQFYVWSDTKPEGADDWIMFPGHQESTWTWDEEAGAYYNHRFYKHQPDLNISNPAVRQEILRIMGFWLELGVSGFRIDAAPHLLQLHGDHGRPGGERLGYLTELRDFLSWRKGDAILLAEADLPMDKIGEYFGDGDRMHMIFNFELNQGLFLALARGDASSLAGAMKATSDIPETAHWANFLRNHDELDLGELKEDELEDVFADFAPEKGMRIYDRGIRRRLAPMLRNNAERIALAHSLLFTLPGTPVLRYGDEIGMGDDLSLAERKAVRTPMQWSAAKNGGFSTADPDDLIRPVIDEGEWGYEQINVEAQRRDPDSLLNRIERMIRIRKDSPEFGRGEWRLLPIESDAVLAHAATGDRSTVVAVHNLSDQSQTVKLDLSELEARCLEDLLNRDGNTITSDKPEIDLDPYGYRWLRVEPEDRSSTSASKE
ncbi:MAG: alpha-amylase family protein, partial [Thermomicrobiales bacterium]